MHRPIVLDACVLFPEWLRDLFLRCAEAGLVDFRWSPLVLAEMQRNLETARGLTTEQTARLVRAIQEAFPEGEVTDFERHVARARNHPSDRHVVAAAMEVALTDGETTIVTVNLKDFRPEDMPPDVVVSSPDGLLSDLLAEHPAALVDIVWAHAQRRKRPPVSVSELLGGLALHAPGFVRELSKVIDGRSAEQVVAVEHRLAEAKRQLDVEGFAGSACQEFLVAVSDRASVASRFAPGVRGQALGHEVAGALFAMLRHADEGIQRSTAALLKERGLDLDLSGMLALTPEELQLLLERGPHRVQ